jgi:hypothetical protein
MRIQPRQQLLEVWRAVVRTSFPGNEWIWGGRSQRNSISDAEQLLCLMVPATEIPDFKLDLPNETAPDVLDALTRLGGATQIPRRLVSAIGEYLRTYTDESGSPSFAGGSYFTAQGGIEALTPEQRALDVVDSFAVSVRLMLATIGFTKVFRRVLTRDDLVREVTELETMANRRLTAAMIGLLRSFSVYVFDVDSPEGRNLCQMVNQSRLPNRRVVADLHNELRDIRAGLRGDVTLGIGDVPDLDNENKLFQCGWSWGVAKDAPAVRTAAEEIRQVAGVAFAAPYLYFTVVALDSIQNLFSERTRLLGLLDEEQQRLARALQIRWDLTQSYWSKLARFGTARWPLEDMPWRTTDGVESDYLSLLVSSIVVQDLSTRPAEREALRVGEVLQELAERARITRRSVDGDQAITLHAPGFPFELEGSDEAGGPRLTWLLADFSPQLLKQTIRVAGLLTDIERRGQVVALADRVWEEHLLERRFADGTASKLWDRPSEIYPELKPGPDAVSWYYTERVTGCLVLAATLAGSPPLRSPGLTDLATDLLAEADHLYDQELLRMAAAIGPSMEAALQRARAALRRAHDIIRERPGTAAALATQVLQELDQLAAARQSASVVT